VSPTYDDSDQRFLRDFARLTSTQRRRFIDAVVNMVDDMKTGQGFRPGLRVKRVRKEPGVWEMTWAPDGRATFHYGTEIRPGEPHVIWRRVGTHDIFNRP